LDGHSFNPWWHDIAAEIQVSLKTEAALDQAAFQRFDVGKNPGWPPHLVRRRTLDKARASFVLHNYSSSFLPWQTFDIKEFHNVMLANGAMPLEVLERIVDGYIEAKLGKTSTQASYVLVFEGDGV
jgi:hypothetical protein